MTHRLRRISVFQAAKMGAVIYGTVGLLAMPFLFLTALISAEGRAMWMGFAFFSPVIYACAGFIGIAIACLAYNMASALVGGLHVDIEPVQLAAAAPDVPPAPPVPMPGV